jgi:hypothetical protein
MIHSNVRAYSLQHQLTNDGLTIDFWAEGTTIFGLAVLISSFKMVLLSSTWNIVGTVALAGGLIVYLITLLVSMTITTGSLYNIVTMY